jgi:cytochrome c553
MKILYALLASSLLVACQTNETPKAVEDSTDNSANSAFSMTDEEYLALGDSVSTVTQINLMANVQGKIKSVGFAGAVDFCNEHAAIIMDSMSNELGPKIRRVSEKNRNPLNGLETAMDKQAWEDLKRINADSTLEKKHLLVKENGDVYYYKTIKTMMTTCIECHGNKETDIKPDVLKTIMAKYPQDKATGYKLGDFRGMWKIKLNA